MTIEKLKQHAEQMVKQERHAPEHKLILELIEEKEILLSTLLSKDTSLLVHEMKVTAARRLLEWAKNCLKHSLWFMRKRSLLFPGEEEYKKCQTEIEEFLND